MASTPIIELLATFLSNRTISVRVGESWSHPRSVHGGVPQGSILGVFLFNAATDDLEDQDSNRSESDDTGTESEEGYRDSGAVSYTHLTLPTTPYV